METQRNVSTAAILLKVDLAVGDSPTFRASLQRNEDQLDELSFILETLVKSSRSCLEHAASTNAIEGPLYFIELAEALGKLAPNIKRMTELRIFGKCSRMCFEL
jgi:hypothetical protein